jgi:pimeloyl-ACP methyl ester carboxylesterase
VEGRKNDVILFESGGGDAVNVWTDLLPEIEKATGATLVTYDRPGFGESEINPANHGFESDMERLEDGLKDLGYSGPFVIVAHSLGGFYAVLFASRHPQEVKAIVMIDANLARFFTDDCLATIRTPPKQLQDYQRSAPGKYCFSLDYEPMARQMRSVRIPASIPVLDLVAGRQSQSSPADADRWRSCHAAFAAEASNRTEITAYGSGHYIYRSNPEMVVAAVAAEHAIANKEPVTGWMYAAITLNELKRKDEQLAHSETGLNQWGYDELRNGDKTGAVKIFELNSALHTSSANVWDSLGDGYEALGDTQSALKSYQKTVEGTHN